MFSGEGADPQAAYFLLVCTAFGAGIVYWMTRRTVGAQFARLLTVDLILFALALVLVPPPWNLVVIAVLLIAFTGLQRRFLVKTFPTFTLEPIEPTDLPTEMTADIYAMQALGFTPGAAFRMNRAGGVARYVQILANANLDCYGRVASSPSGRPFVNFFTVLPAGRLLTNRIGGSAFPEELIQQIDAPIPEMLDRHVEAVRFARELHAVIEPADPERAAQVYRHNFESEQQWVASRPMKETLFNPIKPLPAPPIVTNPDAPAIIARFSAG